MRRVFEVFSAPDGDVYLLRGGSGREHAIRQPSPEDRELLEKLAAGGVVAPAGSPAAERLAPLVAAGVVVPTPSAQALSAIERERFDRQLPYLEDFGDPEHLQAKLRVSSVGILGCGGLGTWALGALAGAGIGRFVLMDDDTVALSNLNRQILYTAGDVGQPKVERARAWLAAFDPTIDVSVVQRRVSCPADLEPLTGCDLVLVTADWPPYELVRWVNEMALGYDVPFLTAGQQPPLVKVGPTYRPGETACLACHETALRRRFPRYDELAEHRRRHPVTDTTLGPASALVGSLLASEALHLLLDQEPATHGRSFTIDLRTLETTMEPAERDPACSACGVRANPSPVDRP